MSLPKTGFVTVLLSFCFLLLTSCNKIQHAAKSTAKATEAEHAANSDGPATPDGSDPVDPGLTDPTLPAVPTGKGKGPDAVSGFDPIKTKTPKLPNVKFEDPKVPQVVDTLEPPEHELAPLPTPKPGVMEPAFKPQLVTLTYVGGRGNQWIQEVGFTDDGKIFAKSGGGGFTVFYSADGTKRLETSGDLSKPSTGPRGFNIHSKVPYRASCKASPVKLEIGSESFSRNYAQPFLTSNRDWKWWGWKQADVPKAIESAGRGVNVHYLHEDRFLAKVIVESGKTSVTKDPRDLKVDNPALITAVLRDPAGPGTLYMVGLAKNGAPQVGTFVKGRALAEAIDPWERLYVGVPWGAQNVPDTFKIGGLGGICILNQNMTTCLFSSTLGADAVYSMALKDNMLVVGGSIGQAFDPDPKKPSLNLIPQRLPVRNPAQELPGGDEDGFLAIIKLW